jgi:hypothetical protein
MEEENLIVDDLSKNTYLEPNIEICDVEDWVVYENENDPAFSHLAKVLLNKIPSNENDIDWDNLDYNLYNKNYYKKMHPKFSDEVCEILEKCSIKKTHDERNLPLKIEQKETIIKMD